MTTIERREVKAIDATEWARKVRKEVLEQAAVAAELVAADKGHDRFFRAGALSAATAIRKMAEE
jgi:hypothetical protein